jgi:hypothetical protein
MLRKLLVGAAHYVVGPFGSDSDLRRHGQKIAARGGKNAKKRAAVAVARKLSLCSCTAYGKRGGLRAALQRASAPRAAAGSLGREAMEQTKTEEVKTTGKVVATLKRRMATADLARTRFGSKEVSAPCELGPPPSGGRPLGRSQHLFSSPNRDGSHDAPSHQRECELPESADRSMARRAEQLR